MPDRTFRTDVFRLNHLRWSLDKPIARLVQLGDDVGSHRIDNLERYRWDREPGRFESLNLSEGGLTAKTSA